MNYVDNIGINIKFRRKELGISQEKLANEALMSAAHLRTLEHCKGNPTVNTLEKIAQCLDTDVIDLMKKPE